jgi:hypothetical protein
MSIQKRLQESWRRFKQDETGAICVGCGLDVVDGVVGVQLVEGGGLACDPTTGLSVDFPADPTPAIAAAQATADSAVASAAYRARLYGADKTQSPVDLGPPAVDTPLLVQGGTYTGTCNGAGDLTITFPNAFPTACLAITVNMGAAIFDRYVAVHDTGVPSAVAIRVFIGSTGAAAAGETVRVTYIAIGY